MEQKIILAGTYTDSGSEGIYSFACEDGKLSAPVLFAKIGSPKYISIQNGLVASIGKFERGAGAAVFERTGIRPFKRSSQSADPCPGRGG